MHESFAALSASSRRGTCIRSLSRYPDESERWQANRLRFALAVVLGILCLTPRSAVGDGSKALARLQASHRDLVDLTATFVHTKEVPLFEEKISSEGILFFRKPDEMLLQYTGPDSSRVLIAGGQLWLYYPELNQAHRYQVDPELAVPGIFLGFGVSGEGLSERFDIESRQSDRIGGFDTELITLTPKAETDLAREIRSIELLFRLDHSLPIRCEFWEASGDHTRFEFSGYRKNPGLDRALFTFIPPEGTEVFELEGETW